MFVEEGQALLAIVLPERWVIANLKETQMTHIRPGLKVTIRVDAYPGVVFHGHVDSIQQGTGSRFSLLPAENATGNYIKVVQRVPVKIVFDGPLDPQKPLELGMSVVPTIDLSSGKKMNAISSAADKSDFKPNKWMVGISVMIGAFMGVMDVSVVNVALPHMMGSFGQNLSAITWVATAYSIAAVIMMTMAGWWSTLIGRKNFYLLSFRHFYSGVYIGGHVAYLSADDRMPHLTGNGGRQFGPFGASDPSRDFSEKRTRHGHGHFFLWGWCWHRPSALF